MLQKFYALWHENDTDHCRVYDNPETPLQFFVTTKGDWYADLEDGDQVPVIPGDNLDFLLAELEAKGCLNFNGGCAAIFIAYPDTSDDPLAQYSETIH